VDDDTPNADDVSGGDDASRRIARQRAAKPATLMALHYRQSSEYGNPMGSGILRRKRPVAALSSTAPEASA
jgi:hypothetical protein